MTCRSEKPWAGARRSRCNQKLITVLLDGLLLFRLKVSRLPSPQGAVWAAGPGNAVGRASVHPRFCFSRTDELSQQPGCWQGTEAPTWGSGSCGVAMGDKRTPSSEPHKGCLSSIPEPRPTYPQLSHVPCTGRHTASRTRRGSKFIAASGTWQLQEPRARRHQ